MHNLIDKQSHKPSDDIIKDADIDNCNTNAAIIKSASTPASLQTIVRFSNGSNMSHTVSYCYLHYIHICHTNWALLQINRFYLARILIHL